MTVGSEGAEVKKLQQFLYDKGLYKEGKITGYFGALTKKAVINFQNAHFNEILKPAGLLKATGYVGMATIKKLNELLECNTNTIPDISFDTKTTNTTYGKKNVFDPSKLKADSSKMDQTNLALCAPKPVSPVCGFVNFNEYQTFPNGCFIEKLGYLKICNGACPCKDTYIVFPDGSKKLMVENVVEPKQDNISSNNTNTTKRYSCSSGKCVENSTGAFLTSNCDGFCSGTSKKYSCNSSGNCVSNSNGTHTSSDCNNSCKIPIKKLLDTNFYDRAKAGGTV
jgi:hypothetical protein